MTKKNRNLRILNKFLRGVRIIIINPATLLIKNRGYRITLFQKLFIRNTLILNYFSYNYI